MDVERRLFHPVRRSRLNKEIVTQIQNHMRIDIDEDLVRVSKRRHTS
ncbi:MAG TPA: hypothetical protein VK201_09950 [bacterium]|jgi:hypothetical protein|nr:hypothetical protein [bacterium]